MSDGAPISTNDETGWFAALKARAAPMRARFDGEAGRAGLAAGSAFAIRVASAALVFGTQVLLVRWIGAHEFGLYVYAATLIAILGEFVTLGFTSSAQRLIPAFRQEGRLDELRGFLAASRAFVFAVAAAVTVAAVAVVLAFAPRIAGDDPVVAAIAATALPAFALASLGDAVARAFGRVHLALVPPFILRPVLLVALIAAGLGSGLAPDARTATLAAVVSLWALAIGQTLAIDAIIAGTVPRGPKAVRFGAWLRLSTAMFGGWSFVMLYGTIDVVLVNAFGTPTDVALYFAAAKTLALAGFVAYAVAAVFGPKFAGLHAAGDRDGLARLVRFAVTWTFWPSLVFTGLLLAAGGPILGLFGPEFREGHVLLAILSAGILARAGVGPAERLLMLTGHQHAVAAVYAGALATAVAATAILMPRVGLPGAALAMAAAMIVEAGLLAVMVRRRLGIGVWGWR